MIRDDINRRGKRSRVIQKSNRLVGGALRAQIRVW
jgi:hypothetical protein